MAEDKLVKFILVGLLVKVVVVMVVVVFKTPLSDG